MQLFEDLDRNMNPEGDLTSALSGAFGAVAGGPSGPSDLRGDDLLSDGTSQDGGTPSHNVGSLGASAGGGLMRRMPGRSTSRSGMSKAISSASLMAMESLRNEPEIWSVCHHRPPPLPLLLRLGAPMLPILHHCTTPACCVLRAATGGGGQQPVGCSVPAPRPPPSTRMRSPLVATSSAALIPPAVGAGDPPLPAVPGQASRARDVAARREEEHHDARARVW